MVACLALLATACGRKSPRRRTLDRTFMELRFECPSCGQHLTATTDEIGVSAPCPGCAETVTVPNPIPSAEAPPLAPVTHAPPAKIKQPQVKSQRTPVHPAPQSSSRWGTRLVALILFVIAFLVMVSSAVFMSNVITNAIRYGETSFGPVFLRVAITYGVLCGWSAFLVYGYWFMRRWAWYLHVGLHLFLGISGFVFVGKDFGLIQMLILVFLMLFGGSYLSYSPPVAASRK